MNLNSFIGILIFIIGLYPQSIETEKKDSQEPFLPYSENIPNTDSSIKMVPIPGGTFMMGSPKDKNRNEDEDPQHQVKVDSFWMGAFEITWDQYELFLNAEVSELKNTGSVKGVKVEVDAISTPTPMYIDMSFGMGREGYPAVNMTHYAAIMYAKWLYAKTGHFYRLPTEAEWEYACRAGTNTAYYFGNDASELNKYAWFADNSNGGYKKVGTKEPNAWGLYDMLGNVSEWTMDQYVKEYHEKLKGNPADNPWIKPTTLYPRSVRGGSWKDVASHLRCTSRKGSSKKWKQRDPQMPKSLWWLTDAAFVGFRLVRPKETPSVEEMEKYWIKAMQDY